MKKFCLLSLSALALVACAEQYRTSNAVAPATIESQSGLRDLSEQRSRKAAQAQDGYANDSAANVIEATQSFLAYRYAYGLIMPAKSVKATSDKHIQICRDAGPAKCQITGASTNSYSDEDVRANLSLRAEPDWLLGFLGGIKADVSEVDGKIQTETTSVDDLTRAILDTDARLKAKRILQKRLENLIETRDAELPDLLTLEREIARVHGEIESATANLKALRARVSMSVVNISYTSERNAISQKSVSPIGRAIKDFVSIISNGIAGVIYVFAYMLPWIIFIVLPTFFAGRWFWRRRKVVSANPTETSEPETTSEDSAKPLTAD